MKPNGVLLVGSVPGISSSEVFQRMAAALPGCLRAIPDGGTGDRFEFIEWQAPRFPPEWMRRHRKPGDKLPSPSLEEIQPTGYGDAAVNSYADFVRLRKEGAIPKNLRFQVCLPSTFGVIARWIDPELQTAVEPLYEHRLNEAIDQILANIPHQDLVIQWDLPLEMLCLEYERGRNKIEVFAPYTSSPMLPAVVDRIAKQSARIPAEIKLGFHLCYGDLNHRHFFEPPDASLMVEMTNALAANQTLGPRMEWIHIPVPKERVDHEYFASLKDLKLNVHENVPGAMKPQLYLGLVHANDEAGTLKRIEAAQAVYPFSFGVATECGWGRTPPEEIDSIIEISRKVTA